MPAKERKSNVSASRTHMLRQQAWHFKPQELLKRITRELPTPMKPMKGHSHSTFAK